MSNKVDYSSHPGNPAAQPFNVNGRRNKTKQKSWWNVGSPNYWKAPKSKKEVASQD